MPPCLYICCHFEILDEQHDPPSRLKKTQDSRRISRRYSTHKERPREKSRAVRQIHRSHHRSPSTSRTHNNHTPIPTAPSSQPYQNHALTTHNLIFLDQSSQQLRSSHKPTQKPTQKSSNKSSNKSSHKPTHKSQQLQEQKKQQQHTPPAPPQTKQNYIAKWLSGLRSMSSLLSSSSSRTRDSAQGESSSVEVVKARDAKGRGKGIRIVSDDVEKEEGTGVAEERED